MLWDKIFEHCEIRAIQDAVDPTNDSIYKIKCRDYSKIFFTPLHEVMKLDPVFVISTLYEEKYRPIEIESELDNILEKLYTIKDPTYTKISKEDLEDLMVNVLNKEIRRLSKKKPTPANIQSEIKESESKPKSGSMSFDNSDSEF